MKIDISKLTIKELIELKEACSDAINAFDDGFLYICEVRSYGSNWKEVYTNTMNVEELCSAYNGDNGIVDIYTTNPNIEDENGDEFYTYGDVYVIESAEEHEKWKKWQRNMNSIESSEEDWKRLDEWVERKGDAIRDAFSGATRPFEPYSTKEELADLREELEKEKPNIKFPVLLPEDKTENE